MPFLGGSGRGPFLQFNLLTTTIPYFFFFILESKEVGIGMSPRPLKALCIGSKVHTQPRIILYAAIAHQLLITAKVGRLN